jgi:hypothetical protein
MKSPAIISFTTISVWATLVILHFLARTVSLLDGPPSGDLYSYSWGFQAFAFLVWPFPVWMVILCTIMILQFILMRRRISELPDCEVTGSSVALSNRIQSEQAGSSNGG